MIVRNPSVSPWIAYTPIITGFGTPANVSFFSRRVGDTLECHGTFSSGTSTGVLAKISLGANGVEGNVTADIAKLSNQGTVVGSYGFGPTGALTGYVVTDTSSQAYVKLGMASGATAGFNYLNANSISGTPGQFLSFYWRVPIVGW